MQSSAQQQGAAPTAAGIKQENQEAPQQHQQQTQHKLLSLQDEAHWLQLAQQYVDMQQQQQQPKSAPELPAEASGVTTTEGTCFKAAAAAAATCGTAANAAVTGQTPAVSGGIPPSSTAESGSRILADLGSVDTAEQGLVIYKAFLQKASELLALAQQQQMQESLGELS